MLVIKFLLACRSQGHEFSVWTKNVSYFVDEKIRKLIIRFVQILVFAKLFSYVLDLVKIPASYNYAVS